jgi:hypothetical protein
MWAMATPTTRTPRSRHAADAQERRSLAAPAGASGSPPGRLKDAPAGRIGERRSRLETRRIARARRQSRRRATVLILLLVAVGLVGADILRRANSTPTTFPRPPASPAATAAGTAAIDAGAASGRSSSAAPSAAGPVAGSTYPATGPGTWTYASGHGPVLGTAGTLRRFRVAVEDDMGQNAATFATRVEKILGDPRGWTASRQLRLQRVPKGSAADFTIYLATPGTSERMCAVNGIHTQRYTSCRAPGQVIINVARYLESVPGYGAPLVDYQTYSINHEVGHELGYGHEACPGPGLPAPVMQQQTLGLSGCVANGWPFLDGRRYAGPPIP